MKGLNRDHALLKESLLVQIGIDGFVEIRTVLDETVEHLEIHFPLFGFQPRLLVPCKEVIQWDGNLPEHIFARQGNSGLKIAIGNQNMGLADLGNAGI